MQVKKYFEKKVSLLSTSDVRYDGELYTVDPSEQSIALKHVNCMGTEGRRSGDQAIAPSDCTYEFIIFRAVNIRELWLDEGNGRRRDLTDEILNPLRSGQNVNYSQQKRSQYDDQQDQGPKRKVGYQSRSQQQYDPYYGGQQAQDPYYGQQGGYRQSGGYGPPPQQYEDPNYPPLPNQGGGYGGYGQAQPPPPQQDYYGGYQQQQGGYQRGYQRQGGYQQRGFQQGGGYQRQRPPQYYNQQRPPQYYNQGRQSRGYPSQGYYNQQPRRYPQQYNRPNQNRRYSQNRGYYDNRGNNQNRGYNNNRRNNDNRGRNNDNRNNQDSQAGTGAFLDNRRLRGDDIDFKDAQDFDFGAAGKEFGDKDEVNGVQTVATEVVNNDTKPEQNKEESSPKEVVDDDSKKVAQEQEETKEENDKKYDKAKSFFDGLKTETKKSKPKQDMQTQKDTDSKTFGSIAATYKSRHINRSNQRGNRNYNNQNRGYNNQNRGYNNNFNQNRGFNQQQQQQGNYTTNKWVPRR